MNRLTTVITLIAVWCTPAVHAQFVTGNQAVQVNAAGRRVVTPPVPKSVGKVCGANDGCHAGSWRMVETEAGLVECTEPWARRGSCRASTFGAQKLRRVWVVKRADGWHQCQLPTVESRCVSMTARPPANLPYDALQ
jgi:hypothetical protein